MRIIVLGSLIPFAALALGSPRAAQEPAWCAAYRNGSNNCGFYTYEQCMATVSGIGGFCNRNPDARPGKPAARKERNVAPKTKRKEEEKQPAAPAQKSVPPAAFVQPAPPQAPAVQPPAAAAQQQASFCAARALTLSGNSDAR